MRHIRPSRLRTLGLIGLGLIVSASLAAESMAETTMEKWLRVLGISVTPQTKGPDEGVKTGNVWVASLASKVLQRVTFDGGYLSPVFVPGDQAIVALKRGSVVQISIASGEPKTIATAPGVKKLIGVSGENPNEILVLTDDGQGRVSAGVLSLSTGSITMLPTGTSQNDRAIVNRLNGWDRAYGNLTLRVETTMEQGLSGPRTWLDVYLISPGQPKQNISQCNEVDCGQPSLSHDGTRVVFVKAEEN